MCVCVCAREYPQQRRQSRSNCGCGRRLRRASALRLGACGAIAPSVAQGATVTSGYCSAATELLSSPAYTLSIFGTQSSAIDLSSALELQVVRRQLKVESLATSRLTTSRLGVSGGSVESSSTSQTHLTGQALGEQLEAAATRSRSQGDLCDAHNDNQSKRLKLMDSNHSNNNNNNRTQASRFH